MTPEPTTIVTYYLEAIQACRYLQQQALSAGQTEPLRLLLSQETNLLQQLESAMPAVPVIR